MQTFNQLFFKKKQIFSYFFKEISEIIVGHSTNWLIQKCNFLVKYLLLNNQLNNQSFPDDQAILTTVSIYPSS